jgi:sigma-B regulation protein RsbU (phosphoserine phosphatase)
MAGVRAVLRDRAAGQSLADLMARINRLLAEDLGGTRFMTMHLSRIDTEAKTFRWVSAGHDPAIIFDPASGQFDEIDEAGVPLGIQPDWQYEEFTYQNLRPGQVITLGTDGIWEAHNPQGDMFGKDRLRQTLRDALAANPNATARQISDLILERLNTFRSGHHATDDVTFVIFRLTHGAA